MGRTAALRKDAPPTISQTVCKWIPRLKQFMREPQRQMCIVVVDEDESAIAGIVPILLHWPNLISRIVILTNRQMPDVYPDRDDIVLLGERARKSPRATVAFWLRDQGFVGTIASISSDDTCPDNCKHHFPHKEAMQQSLTRAKEFIFFLNELILLQERCEKQ